MSQWLFLEDIIGLRTPVKMAINTDCIATISPRPSDSELIMYFSKGHLDPYILEFKDAAACRTAYDDLKYILRYENQITAKFRDGEA